MNNDDLKKLEQNAFRDSMKDGFTEIFSGFLFLMISVMVYQPSFIVIFPVFYIILLPPLIENVRQRFTYPRIGYVKLRTKGSDYNPNNFAILIAVTAVSTLAATLLLTGDISNIYNWVTVFPFTIGVIMFGPSLYLNEKSGSKKYWLLGILSSIFGLIVSYLTVVFPPSSPYDGTVGFCLVFGTVLIVGGILKFLYFIGTHPVLDTQEDEVSEQ